MLALFRYAALSWKYRKMTKDQVFCRAIAMTDKRLYPSWPTYKDNPDYDQAFIDWAMRKYPIHHSV